MDDLPEIVAMYKRLSTSSLLELANDPGSLRREIIPLLQAELLGRGVKFQAEALEKFLQNAGDAVSIKDLPKEKLKDLISERLDSGESIDNLKIFLRENDVDIYQVLGNDDEALRHILPSGKSLAELLASVYPNSDAQLINDVEIIKSDLETDFSDAPDYRINTKREIAVYADPQLRLLLRKEPKNKLLRYKRELIRNGHDLYLTWEAGGSKSYVINDTDEISPYHQCQVGENPIDILLISHEDFDTNILSPKFETKIIKPETAQSVSSNVHVDDNAVHVSLINKFSKDNNDVFSASIVIFKKGAVDRVKIGRLEPNYKFYLLESEDKKDLPKKIKTADGREGILLCDSDAYDKIKNPLEKFVLFVTTLFALAFIIGLVLTILSGTGYIVIIGIVVFAIIRICLYLIGTPMYLLLNSLLKRL